MRSIFAIIILLFSLNVFAGQVAGAVLQAIGILIGEIDKAEIEECIKTHSQQECRDGVKPGPISNGYVPQESPQVQNYQSTPPKLSMEKAKYQCKDIGYKYGTEKFGSCVLELMK